MKEFLKNGSLKADIFLTDKMLEQFNIYYEMMMKTNETMNLTAITEMEDVVQKHFLDSLFLSKYFDLSGKKVIDVGTGAGLPGIPLAIFFQDAQFVLLDSLNKRLVFIQTVLEKCNINNVQLVHGRAEDIGHDFEYREVFDYCISRAVAALPTLLELCMPFVKVGGKFISFKSELLQEEVKQAENAMKILHCNLDGQQLYNIPDTNYNRVFASFYKKAALQKKYPRQAGKPKRNPL